MSGHSINLTKVLPWAGLDLVVNSSKRLYSCQQLTTALQESVEREKNDCGNDFMINFISKVCAGLGIEPGTSCFSVYIAQPGPSCSKHR